MSQDKNGTIAAINPAARIAATTQSQLNKTPSSAAATDIPTQHINSTAGGVKSNLTYEIKGEGSQFIEIKLYPGQSIIGEVSALMYFENGIGMKMRMGSSIESNEGGFLSKLLGMGKAIAKGQKLFMMSFTNTTQKELRIAFSMPYVGIVVPISLDSVGNKLICQNDSFLCATNNLQINTASPGDLGGSFLTSSIPMQKIQGSGTVFLFCGGSLLQQKVIQGGSINVTTGTTLAFQQGISLKTKTIKNVGITGQGHMLTEISGSGNVWLQSLPYKRTKDNLIGQVGVFFGIKEKKKNSVWGK